MVRARQRIKPVLHRFFASAVWSASNLSMGPDIFQRSRPVRRYCFDCSAIAANSGSKLD